MGNNKSRVGLGLYWLCASVVTQLGLPATTAVQEFFLGAFAKLRKATISFVMSVRPSFCLYAWNNSAPTGRISVKFAI